MHFKGTQILFTRFIRTKRKKERKKLETQGPKIDPKLYSFYEILVFYIHTNIARIDMQVETL